MGIPTEDLQAIASILAAGFLRHRDQLRSAVPRLDCSETSSRHGHEVNGYENGERNGLHATLTNVLYTGMVDHKGVLYLGEHDRIIDQETWDRVHETLRHNGSTKGAPVRNKLGALLRGLLFCVPCGTPMMHTYTMRKSKRYRYESAVTRSRSRRQPLGYELAH